MQDPIVNVRLHLCRLLPSLKSVLKLPGDRVLLQKLEQTVRKLISQERDPDASQAIRDAVTEMDRIEVAMETVRVTYVLISRCQGYSRVIKVIQFLPVYIIIIITR